MMTNIQKMLLLLLGLPLLTAATVFKNNKDLACEDPVTVANVTMKCLKDYQPFYYDDFYGYDQGGYDRGGYGYNQGGNVYNQGGYNVYGNTDDGYSQQSKYKTCQFGEIIEVTGNMYIQESLPASRLCVKVSVCYLGSSFICQKYRDVVDVCDLLSLQASDYNNYKNQNYYNNNQNNKNQNYNSNQNYNNQDYNPNYYNNYYNYHNDNYANQNKYNNQGNYDNQNNDDQGSGSGDNDGSNDKDYECPRAGSYSFQTRIHLGEEKGFLNNLGSRWGFTVYVTVADCYGSSRFRMNCQTSFKALSSSKSGSGTYNVYRASFLGILALVSMVVGVTTCRGRFFSVNGTLEDDDENFAGFHTMTDEVTSSKIHDKTID